MGWRTPSWSGRAAPWAPSGPKPGIPGSIPSAGAGLGFAMAPTPLEPTEKAEGPKIPLFAVQFFEASPPA